VTVLIGGSPAVSGRRLQPGRPVDISIAISDREGFTFSTENGDIGSGAYTITATPGSLRTDAGPMYLQFTPSSDRSVEEYTIEVSLRGRPGQPMRYVYGADWAAARGPEPTDVAALEFSLVDEQCDGDGTCTLAPDRRVGLLTRVRTRDGRVYGSEGEPSVPHDRLRVEAHGFDWDPATHQFTVRTDAPSQDESPYRVAVSYVGRDDLRVERRYHVDLAQLRGPEPASIRTLRASLVDRQAIAPGEQVRLNVESAGRTIFRVVPDDTQPLTIVNAGGRGGEGGPGGEGGAGGIGATAFHAGNGGPGGAGGPGGTGGRGGPGGTYEIIAADSSLLTRVVCGGSGGEGGPGGQGGRPGRGGGAGALAGEAQTLNGQNVVVHGYAATGGSAGTPGPAGTVGREGPGGSIDPRVSPAEVQSAMHSLPPELRAAIVLDPPRTSPASRRP